MRLYIVATPIGNLEDMTFRAVRILREVAVVLCEDTRTTKKLLDHYDITTPTMSFHSHSGQAKIERVCALLEEGKDIALVSDAGTPTISDPGAVLVSAVRDRFGDTVAVTPVPGPNAAIAALSVSGVPASDFLFLGFLPHKKGREKLFDEIAASKRTVVFYESPHRIIKALISLASHLESGTEDDGMRRKLVVARELTKVHEEVVSGTIDEVIAFFEAHPGKVRGEFVVVVEGGR